MFVSLPQEFMFSVSLIPFLQTGQKCKGPGSPDDQQSEAPFVDQRVLPVWVNSCAGQCFCKFHQPVGQLFGCCSVERSKVVTASGSTSVVSWIILKKVKMFVCLSTD